MSHEFRQLVLERKIMLSPVPMVAALRIGRSSSPVGRTTRPRKRASSASAKPRASVSKVGRAVRSTGANPQLHRFNQLEARLAKGPRKPRARRGR